LLSWLGATKTLCVPRLRLSVVLGLVACALALARPCAADEPVAPQRYDPGAYPPPAARGSLLLVGAAATTAWYGLALAPALIWPEAPGAGDLRIPVAGPWMALAHTGCGASDPGCSVVWVVARAILIGIDGVGQAGGLAAMAEAAFLPTAAAPRPKTPAASSARAVQWSAVPLVTGPSGLGLGLVGRF